MMSNRVCDTFIKWDDAKVRGSVLTSSTSWTRADHRSGKRCSRWWWFPGSTWSEHRGPEQRERPESTRKPLPALLETQRKILHKRSFYQIKAAASRGGKSWIIMLSKLPRGLKKKSALMELKLNCINPARQLNFHNSGARRTKPKQSFWGRKVCTYNYHQHYWTQVNDEEEEEDHC